MFQQVRSWAVVFPCAVSLAWVCSAGSSLIAQEDAARTAQAPSKAAASAPARDDQSAYFDIGKVHLEVSTSSPQAQLWFDRGLAMCHAFNHEEAVRCFESAIQADPGMPMAYWGMAYAWGPNINNMEIPESQIAQAVLALRLARLQAERASRLELALIDALEKRYTLPMPEDRAPLNKAYADSMREVYAEFRDQPVVVSLFAESLMDLRPWQQWSAEGQPAPETEEIVSVIEDGLGRWPNDPMLCHLCFMPTLYHVQVRFGKWDDILKEPEPAEYLPMTRSVWRYARALAYASTGRLDEADKEAAEFQQARLKVPETNMLFHNSSQQLLKIADAMLRGEIAYRHDQHDQAFELLREAVRLDDALNYDEPWGWMQPARHALGALLLEQGHYEEAEQVFRVDLKKHPHNPWALHGLAEALEHRGQTEQAAKLRMELAQATQRADVRIDRSCYCRLSTN